MLVAETKGMWVPFSNIFQYIQRKASLPMWLMRLSFSRRKGPMPGNGKCTFHRFVGIVEVDEQGFAIARFHKAVGVAVEFFFQGLTSDVVQDVIGQDFCFKMGYRARFGSSYIGGIAQHKNVWPVFRLKGAFVGWARSSGRHPCRNAQSVRRLCWWAR
jgi:hypothetical protein